MASESRGSKGQPYFAANGAPQIDVDPGIVSDYSAEVGNRKVGTTAQRNALAGDDVWDGLLFGDTSIGVDFRYLAGTGWQRAGGKGDSTPFAMACGYETNVAGAGKTVTFPTGRFTVAPRITMTNTSNSVSIMNAQSVTATSFSGAGYNSSGTGVASTWFWMAIQMTPTSADG